MLQAFIIVLREGFEAFLIVAIIFAYLRKSGRMWLAPAVYSAIAASVAASIALGYALKTGVNQSLWEGVLGVVAIVLVLTTVVGHGQSSAAGRRDAAMIQTRCRSLAITGAWRLRLCAG